MPLEYEYQFFNYDKQVIIKTIKKLKFKKKGIFIFKVMVFNHPLKIDDTYIRIRDEGHKITLTYKVKDPKSKFENEDEIIIDNFDTGVKILLNLGCTTAYSYEKIREIWFSGTDEIIFDTNPGEPERMEIESNTKKELDILTNELNLQDFIVSDDYDPIEKLFGFKLNITKPLTFLTVKKELSKFVTKNKKMFNNLIKDQLILYNDLINKKK